MHVAFIGRLAINKVRSVRCFNRFGRHSGHGGDTQSHAPPLFRHMWIPKPQLACRVAQLFYRDPPCITGRFAVTQFRHLRLDSFLHELFHQQTRVFDLLWKREINRHESSPCGVHQSITLEPAHAKPLSLSGYG